MIHPVDVGPASMLVGNLVAGKRIAQATGRELGVVEDQDLIRKVAHDTEPITQLTLFGQSFCFLFFLNGLFKIQDVPNIGIMLKQLS